MKKIGIIIIASLQAILCTAQIAVGKSSGQEMVEAVIKNGFFISKQSFQIYDKKTGKLFGLNGKDEFGTQYSLGIKTTNGYILTDKAIRPWKYNSLYAKYEEKYAPNPYFSSYTALGKNAQYADLSITGPTALNDSLLYLFNSETFEKKGITIDTSKGEKDGWLIWVAVDKGMDFEQSASVSLSSAKRTVEIEDNMKAIDIETPKYLSDSIIGGIFVVPQYAEIGTITFRLCGVIVPNNENWQLICPFAGMKIGDKTAAKDVPKEKVGGGAGDEDDVYGLTPVKDKKAKKNKKIKKK